MPVENEPVAAKRKLPTCWATIGVIAACVLAWFWEYNDYSHPGSPVLDYLVLSLNGIRHGYIWQLLTFQFLHAVPAPWHLLFNCWAIYVFGRAVELTVGRSRMLQLYLLSGVMGGLVQMAASWLFPGLFGDNAVVGASAGAFGLVAAFAVFYPNERLVMLLAFVIPMKIRATTLLWISIGLSVVGILFPYISPHLSGRLEILNDLFENMAHAAHLGGLATGYVFARVLLKGYRRKRPTPPPVIQTVITSPPASVVNKL